MRTAFISLNGEAEHELRKTYRRLMEIDPEYVRKDLKARNFHDFVVEMAKKGASIILGKRETVLRLR